MNHLQQHLAPISGAGWEQIEEEARKQMLLHNLRVQSGALLPMRVRINSEPSRSLDVPIVTTAFPQYSKLGPASASS